MAGAFQADAFQNDAFQVDAAYGPVTGTLTAQEAGQDTFAATGSVLVSGQLAVQETGADLMIAYESAPQTGNVITLRRRRSALTTTALPRNTAITA